MEKKIQNAISKIALDRKLGNIISDEDLLLLCDLQDKTIIWDLLLKEQRKINKKNIKLNPKKSINDIYNTQLLYWTICEIDVNDIRKKEFYTSLEQGYKKV